MMKYFYLILVLALSLQVTPVFAIHSTFDTSTSQVNISPSTQKQDVLVRLKDELKNIKQWVATKALPPFGRRKSNKALWIVAGIGFLLLIGGFLTMGVTIGSVPVSIVLFVLSFYFFYTVIFNVIRNRRDSIGV